VFDPPEVFDTFFWDTFFCDTFFGRVVSGTSAAVEPPTLESLRTSKVFDTSSGGARLQPNADAGAGTPSAPARQGTQARTRFPTAMSDFRGGMVNSATVSASGAAAA
jgi:hypothetical protein